MRYCSNQLIRLQTGRVTDYGTVIVAALLLALLSFDGAAFGPAIALFPFLPHPLPRRRRWLLLLCCFLAVYCAVEGGEVKWNLLPFLLTGAFPRRHGRGYQTDNHPYPPAAGSRHPRDYPRPPFRPFPPLPPFPPTPPTPPPLPPLPPRPPAPFIPYQDRGMEYNSAFEAALFVAVLLPLLYLGLLNGVKITVEFPS